MAPVHCPCSRLAALHAAPWTLLLLLLLLLFCISVNADEGGGLLVE